MLQPTKLPVPQEGMSPFEYAVSLVSGKWKLSILFEIGVEGCMRFGRLRRSIHGITEKVLAEQLRQLENSGLILRREYPGEAVPRVEYSLTAAGLDFVPVIMEMCRWGKRCGWENMTNERGWKEIVTVWGPLGEGDSAHFPTEACRRIHTTPPTVR